MVHAGCGHSLTFRHRFHISELTFLLRSDDNGLLARSYSQDITISLHTTKEFHLLIHTAFASRRTKTIANNVIRVALGIAVALVATGRASAQYGGGTGSMGGTGGGTYTAPGGGYGSSGKAIGIGVGAAAGAGLLFLAMHHSSVTGCVQPAEDGLRFVDEKKNTSYSLAAGDVSLKAGQRVQLQGKKSKSTSGGETFVAKKLVKDLGSCNTAAAPQTQTSGQ